MTGGAEVDLRSARPNVVVVVVDTLRPDMVVDDSFDDVRGTRFLADLAEEGVGFADFTPAGGTTRVSVNAMFTGFHGGATGLDHQHCESEFAHLPVATMPEIFRAAGYTTVGLTQGHLSLAPVGFDVLRSRQERFDPDAITRITNARTGPFFVYLHLYGIHDDAFIHPAALTRSRYAELLADVESELEAVCAATLSAGDLLVVAGDHGCHLRPDDVSGWRFHDTVDPTAGVLLDHEISPGYLALRVVGSGLTACVESPVSGIDVAPTICDAAGIGAPAMQGRSVWPTISAGGGAAEGTADAVVYQESGGVRGCDGRASSRSVRRNGWMYVRYETLGERLYHLTGADPGRDQLADHPGLADDLRQVMERQIADNEVAVPARRAAHQPIVQGRQTCVDTDQHDAGARSISYDHWLDEGVARHLRAEIDNHVSRWHAGRERIALFSASAHTDLFLDVAEGDLDGLLVAVIDGNAAGVGRNHRGLPVLPPAELESLNVDRIIIGHHQYAIDMTIEVKRSLSRPVPVHSMYDLGREMPVWWDRVTATVAP